MAKENIIECTGTVIECLPSTKFLVKLTNSDRVVSAYIAGNMRKFQIRVLKGDQVTLEMSPYDLNHGRIRFRSK